MYKKTVLSNGVRVISLKMRGRDSASVGIMIGAGGRYESDTVKGAAHFLEHILFKGTRKYTCNQIKELIEGVGGALNAFTSEEKTCYYAKIPARHLERAFRVLADMVIAPLIAQPDVDKERTVIMEEIKMYHDLPHYYVLDLLDGLTWPNHPLGKSLIGTAESISNMSSMDLKDFRDHYYDPHNIVVTACGDLCQTDLVAWSEKTFGKIAHNNETGFIKADNIQKVPQTCFSRRDIEQMHLALGMLGLPEGHADKYALNLLHVILGGNMSSRLFNEIREKRGLAYSISTSVKYLKDTGMFMVRAGVDNNKVAECVDLILQELKKIKESVALRDELKRAKDYYIGQVLLGLEDTLEHMLWMGDSLLSFGYVRTLPDIISEVRKIKLNDLMRVAQDILSVERMNLAIVGPVTDAQEKQLSGLLGSKDTDGNA